MVLDHWIAEQRLIVCVGSGGVGKTTTAAAIALYAAKQGRKTVVLTIDPAKRLANALGLESFGNEAHQVEVPNCSGELWAMMLDAQSTWDALIDRLAKDPEVKRRILSNRIYRYIANSLAGSQEYMATEKLHDIARSDAYDLIVLDTPPAKNALDFLESPGRLIHFFDERILKWFLSPYRRKGISRRLMMGPTAVVWRLLGSIFGRDFLDDLALFFQDFRGLYEGFVLRHEAVMALLRSPQSSFVTVFAPNESSAEVASFFVDELQRRNLPRAGIIANQRHYCKGTSHDAKAALGQVVQELQAEPSTQSRVLARLGMAHRRLHYLWRSEEKICEQLRAQSSPDAFFISVPKFEEDIHELGALENVSKFIFDKQ